MTSRSLTPITPITRGSLGNPLLDLRREVNRLFGDMLDIGGFGTGTLSDLSVPRLDVRESEQELSIAAELPGLKRSEVDVRLEGDVLTISGEKKKEVDEEKDNVYLSERSYGRFQRSVQLPFTPDPGEVRADFENGVLNVHLKQHPHTPRGHRIEVREGADGPKTIDHSGEPKRTSHS